MHKPILYLSLFTVLVACKSKNANPELAYNSDSIIVTQDKTAVAELDTALIASEMQTYREKIANRLTEYDEELKRLNNEKEAEKDKAEKEKYVVLIEKREKDKRNLQERLDKMTHNMKEDWKAFKQEIEDFFKQNPSGK